MIACACLCAAFSLVYLPHILDLPFTQAVNALVYNHPVLNVVFYDLDALATFSGVVFLAVLWGCWFSAGAQNTGSQDAGLQTAGLQQEEVRSRILAGVLACIPAGMLSRFLQHRLHSHPRPFFDPALGFHPAFASTVQRLNTWNSFPSDHATVFAALVTVICLLRADLRKYVIPWFAIVEFARLYMGAHYPTDLLGGAALGALAVFIAQRAWIVDLCRRLVLKAKDKPLLFYGIAFMISYQLATLFSEVRGLAHPIQQ